MKNRNPYQYKFSLFVLDMLAFFVALNIAIYLRYSANLPFAKGGTAPWEAIFQAVPFVVLAWLVVSSLFGTYRIHQTVLDEISSVIRATMFTLLALLASTFFYRGFSYSRGMIVFFIPLVLVSIVAERLIFRGLRQRALVRFGGRARVAILGHSAIGETLIQSLLNDHDYYEVVGRIETEASANADESREESQSNTKADLPVLGHVNDIEQLCQSQQFDTLILVERRLDETQVLDSIEACLRHQVNWSVIPLVHELLLDRARVDIVDGIPLVGMRSSNIVGFNWMLKRFIDIAVSLMLIVLAAPIMISIALAIKMSSPGPVLYVQQRIGYRGRTFPFFKFRSMHADSDDAIHREYTRKWIVENKANADGKKVVHKIVNDPRVFAVGRFVRRFSMDELPQLFNVLRGEMSLIGPRPAIPYEVEVYREWHRRRFEAPPGITGLWQVSGRNQLSFEEMIKLDIEYLENWSLLLDLRILFRTIRVVLFEHAY